MNFYSEITVARVLSLPIFTARQFIPLRQHLRAVNTDQRANVMYLLVGGCHVLFSIGTGNGGPPCVSKRKAQLAQVLHKTSEVTPRRGFPRKKDAVAESTDRRENFRNNRKYLLGSRGAIR